MGENRFLISSLSKNVKKWFRGAARHTCGNRMGVVYAQTGKSPFEKAIWVEEVNSVVWYCRQCKTLQLLDEDTRIVKGEWSLLRGSG